MQRINEFLHTRPSIRGEADDLPAVHGGINFEHVSFTYPDTGITRPGGCFVLESPWAARWRWWDHTGSGKSTIAELIARQYDTSSGEIRIDGVPIRRIALDKLRGSIGYVPRTSSSSAIPSAATSPISLDAPDRGSDAACRAHRAGPRRDHRLSEGL
jgi:ATP-binding cassette subfamily B protein